MNILNKENRGQGFWFYELTLIILIVGILAMVSVPIYSSIVSRVKEEVGGAYARMLNIGISALEQMHPEKLPAVQKQTAIINGKEHIIRATGQGTYNHFNEIHRNKLMDFLSLTHVKYVTWVIDGNRYIGDSDSDGIRKGDSSAQ